MESERHSLGRPGFGWPGRSRSLERGQIYSAPEVPETTNRYNENDGVSERVHEPDFAIVIGFGSEGRVRVGPRRVGCRTVTRLLDKARADSGPGDLSLIQGPGPRPTRPSSCSGRWRRWNRAFAGMIKIWRGAGRPSQPGPCLRSAATRVFTARQSIPGPPVIFCLHFCLNARFWAPLPPAITPPGPLSGETQVRPMIWYKAVWQRLS